MSIIGKRQELADALSAVPDVTGYAYKPKAPRAGDAWPTWGGATMDDEAGQFVNGWQVVVYLPQDERRADEWIDEHAQALGDAIQPVAYVDGFAPANLGGTSTIYGLLITTRSE